MTTPIKTSINMHAVVMCPTCQQHEMSVDHIGWDEVGNAICPVCSTNWRIEHPSLPAGMVMARDWVLTERPQEFVNGRVLLRHRRYEFYVVVEECLQGKDPKEHFTHLYDDGTVPVPEILGVEAVLDPNYRGADPFEFVAFASNDQIRQLFGWDWKQFAENGPFSHEQFAAIFPADFRP